jgi:chorismate mutase/prephenate dehydratase
MSACLSLEEPLGISFLGPLGTFTGSAATKHFGHAARLLPQASIDDVFREVESGHAHYAVVPVENSTEGAVGRYDGPAAGDAAQNLRRGGAAHPPEPADSRSRSGPDHQGLFARPVAGAVPRVAEPQPARRAAHPGRRAIRWQAQNWLQPRRVPRRLPARRRPSATSCPSWRANIEDEPNNTTRFLVLGKHDAGVSGRDKTSLIMSAPNRTGALHELLLPLSDGRGVDEPLESRPATATRCGNTSFYVDIEGHRDDAPVKAALEKLARRARLPEAPRLLPGGRLLSGRVLSRSLDEYTPCPTVCPRHFALPAGQADHRTGTRDGSCRSSKSSSWPPTRTRWA